MELQLQDISANLGDVYTRAEKDINFFAALCMPTVAVHALPHFYIAAWQLLSNRSPEDMGKLLRFALGLPRGHAKTTFIKILICWLIVYDKVSFVLIVCSNSDLADSLLADIHDILSSPNMETVYGSWQASLAIDSADLKKAAFHGRPVVIAARGWSAGIRGLNIKNQRPDLIFCDDVQTRKNDESPTERQNLLHELAGTIFKSIAPVGNRLIIYVGNMYSEECILNQFRKNSSWISMITGALLADGTPLWPQLFSVDELMESYYHDEALGLAHVWFAEVMNDPKNIALSLLHDQLPDCDIDEIVEPDGAFITIDPAGFRRTSDDNVIVVHYKFDNKGYVVETVRGILDPQELIQHTLRLAMKHGVSLIAVEDTGYQQTLGFWLTHYIKQLNMSGITVVPVNHHGRSKEQRIRLFIMELYKQSYYILDEASRRDFVWQASMYKIGQKENRDDLLDAVAYGLDIRNKYWHLITTIGTKARLMDGKCRVEEYCTPF